MVLFVIFVDHTPLMIVILFYTYDICVCVCVCVLSVLSVMDFNFVVLHYFKQLVNLVHICTISP